MVNRIDIATLQPHRSTEPLLNSSRLRMISKKADPTDQSDGQRIETVNQTVNIDTKPSEPHQCQQNEIKDLPPRMTSLIRLAITLVAAVVFFYLFVRLLTG